MNFPMGQILVLAYLFLVLLLGGASAAGFGGNTALQLLGAALIAWTLWGDRRAVQTQTGLQIFLVGLAAVAALQFLPLPPFLWHLLPGRAAIAKGYDLAGIHQTRLCNVPQGLSDSVSQGCAIPARS